MIPEIPTTTTTTTFEALSFPAGHDDKNRDKKLYASHYGYSGSNENKRVIRL